MWKNINNKKIYIPLIVIIVLIVLAISVNGYFGNKDILSAADAENIINETNENRNNEIRFITIGDPHVKSLDNNNRGNEKLKQIINFVNKLDVDFVVFMGDMADNGTNASNNIVKVILKNLDKPYYVVAGNHDIEVSPKIFESYYGPMEHIEYANGYQLIFVGIKEEKDKNKTFSRLHWSFDFNKTNKDMPTIVFIHGPPQKPPTECVYCRWGEDVLGYAQDIQPELDKFTNLIGVYSGHVHYTSDQTIGGVRYATINGLITIKLNDMIPAPTPSVPIIKPSNEIGYSVIKNGKLNYTLISYK